MAAPAAVAVVFDKPAYTPGGTITATITATGQNTSPHSYTFAGTITDHVAGESTPVGGSFSVNEPNPLAATATDSGDRTWTAGQAAQAGQVLTAVFTAIA